jgi:hypothetical protein
VRQLKKDHFLIVYAVLAAAIVVCCIALVPIAVEHIKFSLATGKTPEGSFGEVVVKSRYEIQVYMNRISPATNYTECRLAITAPDSEKVVVDLMKDVYDYSMANKFSRLTIVRLHDKGALGEIGPEDYFSLYHDYPILVGVWTLDLIAKGSGGEIASRPVVSPDTAGHPSGTFASATRINEAKFQLVLGTISPTTSYSYCKLMLDPPGSTLDLGPSYVNLTEGAVQTHYFPNNIKATVLAQNQYGIPQPGDIINVTSTSTSIPPGQYAISLVYKYDGGTIALKVFTLTV